MTDWDRRTVMKSGLALGLAPWLVAQTAQAAMAPAAAFVGRLGEWIGGLEPAQVQAASFALDGREWKRWDFMGGSGFIKPGLRLEQMNAGQRERAFSVLEALFSAEGMRKARDVMTLQDVLVERGDGVNSRSSGRYSFALFGTPASMGSFGFRLEGHHLSVSVRVRDGQFVSVTPSSFSSNPNIVTSGRWSGIVALKGEERLARTLFAALTPAQAARARLSDRRLGNILSLAGRETANARKEGLAFADMTTAQADLAWQLIETYTAEHWGGALAEHQRRRVRGGDAAGVHFAWYGPNEPGTGFGYRLIGDGFVIELGSVDPQALHLHTVYHDLETVLGG
jgi:hypothetical protein